MVANRWFEERGRDAGGAELWQTRDTHLTSGTRMSNSVPNQEIALAIKKRSQPRTADSFCEF